MTRTALDAKGRLKSSEIECRIIAYYAHIYIAQFDRT